AHSTQMEKVKWEPATLYNFHSSNCFYLFHPTYLLTKVFHLHYNVMYLCKKIRQCHHYATMTLNLCTSTSFVFEWLSHYFISVRDWRLPRGPVASHISSNNSKCLMLNLGRCY